MAKSVITETVEKTIADDTDFSEVLRDVALGLKTRGFFDDASWSDKVIQIFGSVIETKIDDSIFTDNEHEISSSFVDERSKLITKSKTSTDNPIECDSISNRINGMFDDSNDSFEIPETQAFPLTNHVNDDEDTEGFIEMPTEQVDTVDCSQSQIVLQADELGKRSPNGPDFNESDSIDLEMSKLEWDDSANKSANKNKSASVTPLQDFNFVAKEKAMDYDRSASVTPDLDFDALPSTLAKSIMETLASPMFVKVPDVPTDLNGTKTKNDSTSNCDGSSALQKLKLKIVDESHDVSSVCNVNEAEDAEGDNKDDDIQNAENVQIEPDCLFKRPNEVEENSYEEDLAETQLFDKSDAPDVKETIEANRTIDSKTNDGDVIDHLDQTQVFTKSNDDGSANTSKETDDGYISIAKIDSNQKNSITATVTKDDENNKSKCEPDDNANTEESLVKSRPRKRNRLIESSDDEEEEENASTDNSKIVDKSNEDDVYYAATQKFETVKSTKQQKCISTSKGDDSSELCEKANNEESVVVFSTDESNEDDVYFAATQKFETVKLTKQQKCIANLKRDDWSELCEKANSEQSAVVFRSVFDQCKDLAINNFPVPSSVKRKIVTSAPALPPPPTRQSTRDRRKVKYMPTDDNTSEAIPSKRQKVRLPTTKFIPPAEPLNNPSTSTKSNDFPPSKSESIVEPTSSSSCISESDEVDENVNIESAATQVFMKASSTPKEQTKPLKVLTRRQARAETAELRNPKAVKQLMPPMLTKNRSITYSPQPAAVKAKKEMPKPIVKIKQEVEDVSADVMVQGDKVKSSNDVSSRSRKRKATSDVLSLSIESNESSSSRSSTSVRSARNPNFRVMFTMVDPEPHKASLKELSISIANSEDYNALITDKIYRTSKFMCALAAGRPIVSIDWLNNSKAKKSIMDPFEFILKDVAGEKKYRFNLAKTLAAVRKNGCFFRNHSIFVTPSCNPSPDILKDVITCGGGKYLKTSLVPRKDDIVLCIADQKDEKLTAQLEKKYPSLKEITVEDFMQAIFQYKLDI